MTTKLTQSELITPTDRLVSELGFWQWLDECVWWWSSIQSCLTVVTPIWALFKNVESMAMRQSVMDVVTIRWVKVKSSVNYVGTHKKVKRERVVVDIGKEENFVIDTYDSIYRKARERNKWRKVKYTRVNNEKETKWISEMYNIWYKFICHTGIGYTSNVNEDSIIHFSRHCRWQLFAPLI